MNVIIRRFNPPVPFRMIIIPIHWTLLLFFYIGLFIFICTSGKVLHNPLAWLVQSYEHNFISDRSAMETIFQYKSSRVRGFKTQLFIQELNSAKVFLKNSYATAGQYVREWVWSLNFWNYVNLLQPTWLSSFKERSSEWKFISRYISMYSSGTSDKKRVVRINCCQNTNMSNILRLRSETKTNPQIVFI